MPSTAALTIYLFGITAFVAGVNNLLFPRTALETFGLSDTCTPPILGNGLAALAMGIYYCLAAWQENTAFFMLTVPMRCLTASVFLQYGGAWQLAGYWEGGGALLTFIALISSRF